MQTFLVSQIISIIRWRRRVGPRFYSAHLLRTNRIQTRNSWKGRPRGFERTNVYSRSRTRPAFLWRGPSKSVSVHLIISKFSITSLKSTRVCSPFCVSISNHRRTWIFSKEQFSIQKGGTDPENSSGLAGVDFWASFFNFFRGLEKSFSKRQYVGGVALPWIAFHGVASDG